MTEDVALKVSNLCIFRETQNRTVPIVKDISFTVGRGKVLGLVGESGAGKSMTAKAVLGLLDSQFAVTGSILFQGIDLLSLAESNFRRLRGRELALIFQDPAASLNPVLTIGRQVRELYTSHLGYSQARAKAEGLVMLGAAGLKEPHQIWHLYPFQLSGGMRQRVMIAMAMALGPSLIIADEPTTALDVTLQDQVMRELRAMQRANGMAMLLITHNMGVVAEMADDVAVMKDGEIIEYAECTELFDRPRHPYTQSLLAASQLKEGGSHG